MNNKNIEICYIKKTDKNIYREICEILLPLKNIL